MLGKYNFLYSFKNTTFKKKICHRISKVLLLPRKEVFWIQKSSHDPVQSQSLRRFLLDILLEKYVLHVFCVGNHLLNLKCFPEVVRVEVHKSTEGNYIAVTKVIKIPTFKCKNNLADSLMQGPRKAGEFCNLLACL